jgi:hypothetical protein
MQRDNENREQQPPRPACPVCGSELIEIRAKATVLPLSHDL